MVLGWCWSRADVRFFYPPPIEFYAERQTTLVGASLQRNSRWARQQKRLGVPKQQRNKKTLPQMKARWV